MRAALYARVSSAGQRDRHTIESQLRDLPAFATARGWTVVGVYTDDGKSAAAGKLAARCLGRRHPRPGHVRCVLPTRAAARVDARLWEALTDAIANPSVVDRALAYLDQRDTAADDPEPHRLEVARLDRAQSAILAQLTRGTVSQDVADAQIDRLGRARRDAHAALAEAQRRAAGIRGAVSGDRLAESLAALARGCELAATRPESALSYRDRIATQIAALGGAP